MLQVFDDECKGIMDESLYNPFLGQLKVSFHNTCKYYRQGDSLRSPPAALNSVILVGMKRS